MISCFSREIYIDITCFAVCLCSDIYRDKKGTLTSERKCFLVRDKAAASYLQHGTLILIPKEVSFSGLFFNTQRRALR